MDIKEIRQARINLEKQMTQMCQDFEKLYEVNIHSVYYGQFIHHKDAPKLIKVQIKLE